jgi:hypothetical protein
MHGPRSFEEPVVASTEIIGTGFHGASKVQRVERLEPSLVQHARQFFDIRREPNELLCAAEYIQGVRLSHWIGVPSGLVFEGVGRDHLDISPESHRAMTPRTASLSSQIRT